MKISDLDEKREIHYEAFRDLDIERPNEMVAEDILRIFESLERDLPDILDRQTLSAAAHKRAFLQPDIESSDGLMKGRWDGNVYALDDGYVPSKFNESGRNIAEIRQELYENYGIELGGIPFTDGVADFSGISVANISVDDIATRAGELAPEEFEQLDRREQIDLYSDVFSDADGRQKRNRNFEIADSIAAERQLDIPGLPKGYTKEDLKAWREENHFSWDEQLQDGYNLVPSVIHGNVAHTGLVGVSKNAASFLEEREQDIAENPEVYSWDEQDAPISLGELEERGLIDADIGENFDINDSEADLDSEDEGFLSDLDPAFDGEFGDLGTDVMQEVDNLFEDDFIDDIETADFMEANSAEEVESLVDNEIDIFDDMSVAETDHDIFDNATEDISAEEVLETEEINFESEFEDSEIDTTDDAFDSVEDIGESEDFAEDELYAEILESEVVEDTMTEGFTEETPDIESEYETELEADIDLDESDFSSNDIDFEADEALDYDDSDAFEAGADFSTDSDSSDFEVDTDIDTSDFDIDIDFEASDFETDVDFDSSDFDVGTDFESLDFDTSFDSDVSADFGSDSFDSGSFDSGDVGDIDI